MRRGAGVMIVVALAGAGCLRARSDFVCSGPEACVLDQEQGVCEPSGYCSFFDPTCMDSLRRYGEYAGAGLAGECVAGPAADAGHVPADDGGSPIPCAVCANGTASCQPTCLDANCVSCVCEGTCNSQCLAECSLVCAGTASCGLACPSGACSVACLDSAICAGKGSDVREGAIDCGGAGRCQMSCMGSAFCWFECTGGGCVMTCRDWATCHFDCQGGGCTFICGAAAGCTTTCVGLGCTTTTGP